jgi:hypothetical protein
MLGLNKCQILLSTLLMNFLDEVRGDFSGIRAAIAMVEFPL